MLKNRIDSVDAFRAIAIFFIILVHTHPFLGNDGNATALEQNIGLLIRQLTSFSVPFFFIISGYFFGRRLKSQNDIAPLYISITKRLLIAFSFWSIIYVLPFDIGAFYTHGITGPFKKCYWHIHSLLTSPWMVIFEGTRGHLWFLSALGFAISIFAFLVYIGKAFIALPLGLLLYTLGVLSSAYAGSPLSTGLDFNPRNGPFWSLVFFSIGWRLSFLTPNHSWFMYGFLTLTAGATVQYSELYFLERVFGIKTTSTYLFGTLAIGTGVAMLALSNIRFPSVRSLASIGPYTLGIYGCHNMFVDILEPMKNYVTYQLWEIIYPIIVLATSYFFVRLLHAIPRLRKVLT